MVQFAVVDQATNCRPIGNDDFTNRLLLQANRPRSMTEANYVFQPRYVQINLETKNYASNLLTHVE